MKKLTMVAVFVSAMGVHGVANAEFYLTGDVAITSFDYSNVDNATGYQLGAGYSFDNNIFLEFRYLDSGKADVDGSEPIDEIPGATVNDTDLELSGYLATIGYMFPFGVEDAGGIFVRGGLYSTDTEVSGTVTSGAFSEDVSDSEDSTGITIGLGLEWMPTRTFGLRASIDGLINNKDFADDNNVTVVTLGTVIRF